MAEALLVVIAAATVELHCAAQLELSQSNHNTRELWGEGAIT